MDWLLKLFAPTRLDKISVAQRVRLIKAILVICALLAVVFMITGGLSHNVVPEPYILFALVLLAWCLVGRGTVMPVGYAIPFAVLALITNRLGHTNGVRDTLMPGYMLVIMFAALLLGRRAAALFVLFCIGAVAWLIQRELSGAITPNVVGKTDFTDLISISVLFSVAAVLSSIIVSDLNRTLLRLRESEQALAHANQILEQRVQERTAQLEEANRELDAFSASVSHDLRAPLRAVRSYITIIQKDFSESLDPAARPYVNKAITAASEMNDKIDGLLKFSRLSRAEMNQAPLDLSAMAANIFATLAAADSLRQVDCPTMEQLTATGDPVLIQTVLENLIGNAWKYTAHTSQARIEFGALQADGNTVFFIRDNGAGFNMKYTDKLFGAFQRLHRVDEFPGHGIGLATVQRIIHRHGGRIWAEGEVGKGATFYFTLGRNKI